MGSCCYCLLLSSIPLLGSILFSLSLRIFKIKVVILNSTHISKLKYKLQFLNYDSRWKHVWRNNLTYIYIYIYIILQNVFYIFCYIPIGKKAFTLCSLTLKAFIFNFIEKDWFWSSGDSCDISVLLPTAQHKYPGGYLLVIAGHHLVGKISNLLNNSITHYFWKFFWGIGFRFSGWMRVNLCKPLILTISRMYLCPIFWVSSFLEWHMYSYKIC